MSDSDRAWIAALIEQWAATDPFPREVKTPESGLEPDDGGVPMDMVSGPIGPDGARWRAIPSTVTEARLAALESRLEGMLPPLFRLYLTSWHHLVQEIPGDPNLLWPSLPSDAALSRLSALIDGNGCLVRNGYAPFARYAEGDGVLSFDLRRRATDGDCPVVGHEIDRIEQDLRGVEPSRADLERFATSFHPSARAFFEARQARAT
ncbi:MAG: hypothetical protein KC657_05375 [Myxococcales bacterium]|nr:hypothetical protein [Myxococcales bacterium]